MMMRNKPEPGTRVRLTGDFLRSTGQQAGGEGQSKWTVAACDCRLCTQSGPFLAVDEPHYDTPNRNRHFNYHNLEKTK